MLEEGLDTTTFLHKSIMEYYAAAFIAHSMDEVATMFYTGIRESSHLWWEVLSFLKNIDPYRFTRDFEVIEIKSIQEFFLKPLSTRSDADLIMQIQLIHPNLGVEMGPDQSSGHFLINMYGQFSPHRYMSTRMLDDLLIHAIDQTIPEKMSLDTLLTLVRSERAVISDQKSYQLSLATIIKEFGSKYFWQSIDIFTQKIAENLKAAQLVLDGQQKRKLIFTKKTA